MNSRRMTWASWLADMSGVQGHRTPAIGHAPPAPGPQLAGRKTGNLITVIAGDMRIQDLPICLRNREVIGCSPTELSRLLEYTRSEPHAAHSEPEAAPARSCVVAISDFTVARSEILTDVSWPAAYEHARSVPVDGRSGWRLPTLDELQAIRQRSVFSAAPCSWSGEQAGHGEAFYVHFDDGHVGRGPKSFSKGLCAVFVRTTNAPQ